MQHRLKTVARLESCEILDIPEWLGEIPSDNHTIRQFFHIVSSEHPRLKERADRRSTIDQCAGHFRKRVEPSHRHPRLARIVKLRTATRLWRAKADQSSSAQRNESEC